MRPRWRQRFPASSSTPQSISAWQDSDYSSSGRATRAGWFPWRKWREGIQPPPLGPLRDRNRRDLRIPRPAVVGYAAVPRSLPRLLRLLLRSPVGTVAPLGRDV